MKRYYILPLIISMAIVTSCGNPKKEDSAKKTTDETATTENPLLTESSLPFGVPNFDKIESSDYLPAILSGIEKKTQEITAIANNAEKPTFKNTLVALEKAGQDLGRVLRPFYLLTGADTDDVLQKTQEEIAPKLAALSSSIYLNEKLFQRIKTIHDQLDQLDLDDASERLVNYYYNQFVLSGANLPEAKKDKLKKIGEEIASLKSTFRNKLLAANQKSALLVDDKAKLKGLSNAEIEAAAAKAADHGHKGKFEIPLKNTTQQPALAKLDSREMRKKLFELSVNRAELGDKNDTREVVLKIANLRAKKASILGYDSYAEWSLQDQMAKSPEAVEDLLGQIVPAATQAAKEEAAQLQEVIEKSGEDFKLKPWDWAYYTEKLRKAKYDLDASQIKPYFELYTVLEDGVFYAAHLLYGLSFEPRTDIPVYNDDVRVYEVKDSDGSTIGLFYADYFKRDSKRGGAWMSNLVGQSYLMDTKPVIYNVCNFPKPTKGNPALLTFEQVSTMFHEFGHALHGFFADQKYPSLSGTATARDFVEFPSQFNEHWATYPKVLKHYAKHYKTGEVIPQDLLDKIDKASAFNQGFAMTEVLAAAQLDMQWHMIPADNDVSNVDKFEEKALTRTHLNLDAIPPRYRTTYFNHIWGSGYAAGYYAYVWTHVLADDAYSWFEENGGLTLENGQRFRDMVLSQGNTKDYGEMFEDFRGHAPDITPLLRNLGFVKE